MHRRLRTALVATPWIASAMLGGCTSAPFAPERPAAPAAPASSLSFEPEPGEPRGIRDDARPAWMRLDSFAIPPQDDVPHPSGEADPESNGWHTFRLSGGGAFLLDFDTEARLFRNRTGGGTGVVFENDLGLDSRTETIRIDTFYRFNRHHRVNLSYYDIDRTSTRRLEREIEWGDETFVIGADVQGFFNTEILKLSYQWTFLPCETWELGTSIGFHWMRLSTGIGVLNTRLTEDFEQNLPLPVLGLHGEWHFADRFRLRASSEFLWVQLSGVGGLESFEGYILDSVLAVEWDFFEPLGLGVGYNYFIVDTTFGGRFLSLEARYAYQGVLFYGTLSF